MENTQDVVPKVRDIIAQLQHRGELGAGLAWLKEKCEDDDNRIGVLRGPGKVKQVLSPARLAQVEAVSSLAIAHTRYATNELLDERFFQPFHYPNRKKSQEFAFGFNGNIFSYEPQLHYLREQGVEHEVEGDTDLIGQLIAERLSHHSGKNMQKVIRQALGGLLGAFNPVMMTADQKLLALRDRNGRHPLVYGQMGSLVAVASEDIAIREVLPHAKIRDIPPGKMLEVDIKKQRVELHKLWEAKPLHCYVERIYFGEHRSTFDGTSVSNSRFEAGKIHGELDRDLVEHLLRRPGELRPIVLSVPNSAKTAGRGFGDTTGLQGVEAIFKNNVEDGRTFTAPTEAARRRRAEEKYSYDEQFLRGRTVFLFDDSMVRGLTMEVVVGELRKRGVKEVHLRLASAPFLGPCFYGIDFPTVEELIARKYSDGSLQEDGTLPNDVLAKIAKDIKVDSIRYLPVTKIPRMLGRRDSSTTCMSCVTCKHDTKEGQRLYQVANSRSNGA